MIDFDPESIAHQKSIATIKVVGVGGAGGNTVNSIIQSGCQDIDFIVVNTDVQALDISKAPHKVQMGIKSTKGLGTGANPDIGKRAAQEDLDKIMDVIGDADIVFLTGGMGGGTGSGALPVIAKALKEKNILSIAIVTKPFLFEGKRRANVAMEALEQLKKEIDTLIIIPNQKLLDVVGQNVSMIDAFAMINELLSQSVRGISNIITKAGHINVDYADVRTIMKDRGLAVMGTGRASGENRAVNATLQAISSPLLENMSITGAHGVLFNITGGKNLGLHEISQAASIIYEQAHEDATIIIGSVIDEQLTDEVAVTIIATGFDEPQPQQTNKLNASIWHSISVSPSLRDQSTQNEDLTCTAPEKIVQPKIETIDDNAKNPEQEPTIIKKQECESVKKNILIDPHDLDIPTFMRRARD